MEQFNLEGNDLELNKAKEYIYSFDLSYVSERLIHNHGWRKGDVLQTEKYYRNYLFLNKKYGSMPPSEDVDQFFHEHILFTEKYHHDTQIIFKTYLHHRPTEPKNMTALDNANTGELFNKFQELHKKEFGEYVYATKSRYGKFLYKIVKKILRD